MLRATESASGLDRICCNADAEPDTSGWYSSRRVRAGTGAFKTITDKGSGQLVGAHLFGHNAEETINLFALAIRAGLTAEQLRHWMFGYPTSASDITYMV